MYDDRKEDINKANNEEYEEPSILEKMKEEPRSIHAERLMTKYQQTLETKSLILYRKSFYDEPCEKLIVMDIQLKYPQNRIQDGLFTEDFT